MFEYQSIAHIYCNPFQGEQDAFYYRIYNNYSFKLDLKYSRTWFIFDNPKS